VRREGKYPGVRKIIRFNVTLVGGFANEQRSMRINVERGGDRDQLFSSVRQSG
jgi:hypothetical protein